MAFDVLAVLISGFIFGFALAFGIGSNDVANTFGTTIGSGSITVYKAFILASIFEILGAIFLGGGVTSTIAKGIIDVNVFAKFPHLLMLGYLAALIASTIWLLVATMLKLPVSGTQAAVGAMLGMGIVVVGFDPTVIHYEELAKIALSWLISPLMSGVISSMFFLLMKATISINNSATKQLRRTIIMLPLFYAIIIAINVFGLLFERPLFVDRSVPWPWYPSVIVAVVAGFGSAIVVHFCYSPKLEKLIMEDISRSCSPSEKPKQSVDATINLNTNGHLPHATTDETPNDMLANSSPQIPCGNSLELSPVTSAPKIEQMQLEAVNGDNKGRSLLARLIYDIEWPGIFPMFTLLQIIASCFGSMQHGGNDVANAVAPITGMYEIYKTGQIPISGSTPEVWILFYGGVGMVVGLWALGKNVVKTLGQRLAVITPPKGFLIKLGTTTTALIANQTSIPISTTFCEVGSIVFIGMLSGHNEVSWRLLFQVIMAWVFTVPLTALLSAGIMAILIAICYPSYLINSLVGICFNATVNATSTTVAGLTTTLLP